MNHLLDESKRSVFALKLACVLEQTSVSKLAQTMGKKPHQLRRAIKSAASPNPIRDQLNAFIRESLKDAKSKIAESFSVFSKFNEQEHIKLRMRLRRYIAETPKASLRKVASRVGLSHVSVAQWVDGTYKANPANITAKIRRFLEAQGVQTQESAVSK